MRILMAGASGLIGTNLRCRLTADGHEVRSLVRRPREKSGEYRWDPAGRFPMSALDWADGLVNLGGAPLTRLPWTPSYRTEIARSRVQGTTTLARALAAAANPPTVWVNASAVGFYGDRPREVLTEESDPGDGFLAEVVQSWESATEAASSSTRVVLARTGLVLAREGALGPVLRATRSGFGATIGNGRQHWPWIGLADESRALAHLLTASELSGPVNLVGPTPARSKDITDEVARKLRRPRALRLPAPLLRLGLGAAADELLLADQQVLPTRLTADGFAFLAPDIRGAIFLALRGCS